MKMVGPLAAAITLVCAVPILMAAADGVDVHWTSRGAGARTIILVHTLTGDDSSWSEQVAALSRKHTVITLDLPGHGRSGTPATFTIELFARAIEGVRHEVAADRVVLVGHGSGAVVIRKYALMYPQHVSALVLASGVVQIADDGSGPDAHRLAAVTGAEREALIRRELSGVTSPHLHRRILKMMLAAPDTTATNTLFALHDRSQWTNDPVTTPVLAIYGGRFPHASEDAVRVLYPRAEYYRMPDSGHFLMMEAPETFNSIVEAFLDRLVS